MKKQTEASQQPIVRRRAIPGGRTSKTAEQRLKQLGVDDETIQYLLSYAQTYADLVELGEPIGTAAFVKSLKEIQRETTNYLNMLNAQPEEARNSVFDFGRKGFTPDEEQAILFESLESLKASAAAIMGSMPPVPRHSHPKFWPRNFIARIGGMLDWDLTDPAEISRLGRVIEALNEQLPQKAQITKPANHVREVFGKASD